MNNLPIIITAMHRRPQITKLFGMAVNRIRQETGVRTFSAVSRNDHENIDICNQYDIPYIECRNDPIGAKWNIVAHLVEDEPFSHLIVLGSDDIASTSFIQYQIDHSQYDLTGVNDLWLLGLNPIMAGYGVFGYWQSKINNLLGVGRMVSRRMVEALNYRLWDDNLNMGLDRSMIDKVRPLCSKDKIHEYSLKEQDVFIMDIKYDANISSMAPQAKTITREDRREVWTKHLSAEEVNYLNKLYEKVLH